MDFTLISLRRAFPVFLNLSLFFLLSFYTISHTSHGYVNSDSSPNPIKNPSFTSSGRSSNCSGVHRFPDYPSKCSFVRSENDCRGKGYLNYLEMFYCSCGNRPAVGYTVLVLWLLILFYVLGNTTAVYFCPSVENLSKLLKLSPTVAGTTLLPFGNGANDVFSTVISFTRSGNADVGLNSVLGGAFFICCFVVGIVCISVSSREIAVDRASFVRDVLFYLFVLCCLIVIVAFEQINLWFALGFVSLYLFYIALVFLMQLCRRIEGGKTAALSDDRNRIQDEFGGIVIPLLEFDDRTRGSENDDDVGKSKLWKSIVFILELPLALPRRLTIPDVSEENWSKPFAVASAGLSPILLAAACTTQLREIEFESAIAIVLTSALVGVILGILTVIFTSGSSPPRNFIFPWLAGSFVMSIAWTYITVEELVSCLVSLGTILGTNPSILGFTVLAWGNSVGDLISNLTMAVRGGPDGLQVAVAGCYAGPLFNTLVGLGLSLVFAAWQNYPEGVEIPGSRDLYEAVGFLMAGLLWAVVVLPKKKMKMDKSVGVGLLALYFCFLFLRVVKSAGLLSLGETQPDRR